MRTSRSRQSGSTEWPREKQASRIIPVVLALDDFRSSWSHELSDVDLQAFADRRHILQIAFFEVLIEPQFGGTGRAHHIHRLPETERNVVAEAVGVVHRLISDQFDHVQAELI